MSLKMRANIKQTEMMRELHIIAALMKYKAEAPQPTKTQIKELKKKAELFESATLDETKREDLIRELFKTFGLSEILRTIAEEFQIELSFDIDELDRQINESVEFDGDCSGIKVTNDNRISRDNFKWF